VKPHQPTQQEINAALRFQSGGSYSMPLQPGDKARIHDQAEVFTVMAFDGHVYRLRSDSGAELKAGRKMVERA